MSEQFWLSDEQVERLAPYLPRSRGKARVDDRRVLSGIIHVQRNGLRWCDAPAVDGPHKRSTTATSAGPATACSSASSTHWRRPPGRPSASSSTAPTSRHTARQRACCRKRGPATDRAHQRRAELQAARRLRPACPTRRNAAVTGTDERPQGRRAADRRASPCLRADRRPWYDSDGFRAALEDLGITPCIPSRKNRKQPHPHDPALYRQRHPIENLFAKLKDWRRIATRYDRCADIFMGAITFAAIVIFWLRK
jgi:transposase